MTGGARPGRPGRGSASRAGGSPSSKGARARRGNVTVVAGVFMVGLTAFGSIAIDLSRIFIERAQLQTVVDAAALAGAMQMLSDSSTALDTARSYATRNGYRGGSDEGFSNGDALLMADGVWDSAQRLFVDEGSPEDAVRVRIYRRMPYLFSRMLGTEGIQLDVTAIAWSSAPVAGSNECVKPIMLPFSYVRNLVNPPTTEMTQEDLRRLRELTDAERTDTFVYGNGSSSPAGKFLAVTLPPVVRANGQAMETPQGTYQQYLGQCLTTNVAPGDWLLLLPGDQRSPTVDGVRDLCQADVDDGGMGGTFTGGTCFVSGTARGVPMKVAFWDSPPVYGDLGVGAVQVQMLGSFVMTHIDQRVDPATGSFSATIRGHLTAGRDSGPVSNTPSLLRRPVIVR